MKSMFSVKENSPSTTVATGISDSSTTIILTDATILPEAPSIFTIGYDTNNPELIYYPTSPTGNTLSNVVRGYNSTTAQAWNSGSNVARVFTGYDYNAIVSNIRNIIGMQITLGGW